MRKATVREILLELARRKPELLNSKGEVSQNKLARATGIGQGTISRTLRGESQQTNECTIQKLADYFEVLPSQMRGDMEIMGLFPDNLFFYEMREDLNLKSEMERALKRMTPGEFIERFLEIKDQLSAKDRRRIINALLDEEFPEA